MKEQRTTSQLEEHRDDALQKIKTYIDTFIKSEDQKTQAKADKFCYWLKDYIRFLNQEKSFDPKRRKRYKRGEIIKANLGFNVGSEEGGLHYCVVLDKHNPLNSPVITITPLTSVKEDTNLENMPQGNIYLGQEIYNELQQKIHKLQKQATTNNKELQEKIEKYSQKKDSQPKNESLDELEKQLKRSKKITGDLIKLKKEISRMKQGSIALTGQIRTISKIRIYNPTNSKDTLSNIRLSNEKLDLIDKAIIEKYTNF